MRPRALRQWLVVFGAVGALGVGVASCAPDVREQTSGAVGDPVRGEELVEGYGCISCHAIEGTSNAAVGPPLDDMGRRGVIAGQMANTPENMVLWLMDPQGVDPGNAMPDLDVTEEDAQDMTSYLYQLQ